MIAEIKSPIAIASTFLWIGFVCAISFMEAPLKFQAPGMTLPVGLEVGRIVFGALNKIEWVFALALLLPFLFKQVLRFSADWTILLLPFIMLALQTVWILPALDARAELYIHNKPVSLSFDHMYYIAGEIIKVCCLAVLGVKQLLI